MIGNVPVLKKLSKSHSKYELYIPINFWFTKLSTAMFPICALDNANFQIKVRLNEALSCINYKCTAIPSNKPNVSNSYLLVDYIFLSDEENYYLKHKKVNI